MLIRPWVHSHTQNGVCEGKDRQAEAHSCTTPQPHLLLPNHSFKMHLFSRTPTHSPLHTHTGVQQVQADSAQYLGGYSGEGRALRDVFGYLQSLYPQGSKNQLLLGRAHGGRISGGKGGGLPPKDERAKGKTYRDLSRAHTPPCCLHFTHQ